MSTRAKPWEQQAGESAQAFAAFKLYRDAGAGRSVDAAYRASKGLQESNKRAPGRWREWSLVFDWSGRAALYDEHLAEIEERAREAAANESAELLARRRAELKQKEFELAELLIAKAKEMLDFPLQIVTVENVRLKTPTGERVFEQAVIKPGRWSFRDTVRFFEMASKLARLGLDLKPSSVGGEGFAEGDEDGNVQWSVKLPPDVDEQAWLELYKPGIKRRAQESDPGSVEPVNDKVM